MLRYSPVRTIARILLLLTLFLFVIKPVTIVGAHSVGLADSGYSTIAGWDDDMEAKAGHNIAGWDDDMEAKAGHNIAGWDDDMEA
jgi:hypothetical protein